MKEIISEIGPGGKGLGSPLEKILNRLKGVKPSRGGSYSALCPAHNDRQPSLSVSEGEDGRVLLRCHRGCPTERVVSAIGLSLSDVFVNSPQPPVPDPSPNGRAKPKGKAYPR